MRRRLRFLILLLSAITLVSHPHKFPLRSSSLAQTSKASSKETLQRLNNTVGGRVKIKTNRGTGRVDFVSLGRGTPGSLSQASNSARSKDKSARFAGISVCGRRGFGNMKRSKL